MTAGGVALPIGGRIQSQQVLQALNSRTHQVARFLNSYLASVDDLGVAMRDVFAVPVATYDALGVAGHVPRVVERRLNVVPRSGTKDKERTLVRHAVSQCRVISVRRGNGVPSVVVMVVHAGVHIPRRVRELLPLV